MKYLTIYLPSRTNLRLRPSNPTTLPDLSHKKPKTISQIQLTHYTSSPTLNKNQLQLLHHIQHNTRIQITHTTQYHPSINHTTYCNNHYQSYCQKKTTPPIPLIKTS